MISVIVPVYNVKIYLSECIESIIRQTYSDLDIILVDDGSTDGSGELCEFYAKKDSRIRVFHKKNGGMSDARNYGIKKVLGDEITFVDSDDVIADNMIESLYIIKHKYDAQMSICCRSYMDHNGRLLKSDQSKSSQLYVGESMEDIFQKYFECSGVGLVVWGRLYDKTLFSDLSFPIARYNEDVFVTYKLLSSCDRIVITTQGLYHYRIRKGSIMNRPFEKQHLDMIYASIEMTQFLERNCPNQAIYSQILLIYASLKAFVWMSKTGNIIDDGYRLIVNVLRQYKKLLFSNHVSTKARMLGLAILTVPKFLIKSIGKLVSVRALIDQ